VIKKYKMNNKVNEKGYRNRALTDEQKLSNREKSKNKGKSVTCIWFYGTKYSPREIKQSFPA